MSGNRRADVTERSPSGHLSLQELTALADIGDIATVLVVAPDLQGRFAGKRYTAAGFLDSVAGGAALMCTYVLDRDVENQPFDHAWDGGFDDMLMVPDMTTLRRAAWLPRSAIVICDLHYRDGSPVDYSPRQILRRQIERLAQRQLSARAASELEFIFYRTGYDEAMLSGYRDLRPALLYNTDFNTLGPTAVEDYLAPLRDVLRRTGLTVEDCKGESNNGQLEINFRYTDVLTMADEHIIYKEAAKSLAREHGGSVTFMPKVNEREGNSCHIHMSIWQESNPAFVDQHGNRTPLFESFLAGQIAHLRELTYFFAPNVNSYKRFADRSFAPTNIAWGEDNRTCSLRVVGEGKGLRFENRIGGGDCNPYLAFSAMIAMGLRGLENNYALEPPVTGNAYQLDGRRKLAKGLPESLDALQSSDLAREAFGTNVVEHYLVAGWHEQREFSMAVTDWELRRNFERL